MEMCVSDGYANPICGKFTLSVEDPIKAKKKKATANEQDTDS
jgi:hypothetical protein